MKLYTADANGYNGYSSLFASAMTAGMLTVTGKENVLFLVIKKGGVSQTVHPLSFVLLH